MRSLNLVLTLSFFVSSLLHAQQEAPSRFKRLDSSFHHKQTDIILPARIEGFQIVEMIRYGNSDFNGDDISIRFKDGLATVDVFFYRRGKGLIKDDQDHKLIWGQIDETYEVLKNLAEIGEQYKEFNISDKARVTSYGDDFTLIEVAMSYRQKNKATGKFNSEKLESSAAVTIYSDYFVKIRYSFSQPSDEKLLLKYRAKRKAFIATLVKLIAETELRPEVFNALKKFRENPSNKDAMSVIAAYVEASPLIQITIRSEYIRFVERDNFKGEDSLLASYCAGNMEAQLQKMDFQSYDLQGVQSMIKTYQTLRKLKSADNDPTLDQWLKLTPDELKHVVKEIGEK